MTFLLQQVLCEPASAVHLNSMELNHLISQGRSARLLASLALELDRAGFLAQIPYAARRHFESAIVTYEKQKRDLAYDIGKLRLALAAIGEQLVLLKGAAYLQAELPSGRGRLITDIDILVPQQRINQAEKALNSCGWESSDVTPYDQNYYRKWSHEIPPLTNWKRGTTLDVHHSILPPTCGPNVDSTLLFNNLIEIKPGVYTLSLQDMVIHSATHLFHEGEFHHGLRDLWDLDRMLRDFPERDPAFWEGLISRAHDLDLIVSLFHGLNYVQQVFATPVPAHITHNAANRFRKIRKPVMDFLFLRAFRPDHPLCKLPLTGLALETLYIRSHYLRMPLYMLLPHLIRKAWIKRFGQEQTLDEETV